MKNMMDTNNDNTTEVMPLFEATTSSATSSSVVAATAVSSSSNTNNAATNAAAANAEDATASPTLLVANAEADTVAAEAAAVEEEEQQQLLYDQSYYQHSGGTTSNLPTVSSSNYDCNVKKQQLSQNYQYHHEGYNNTYNDSCSSNKDNKNHQTINKAALALSALLVEEVCTTTTTSSTAKTSTDNTTSDNSTTNKKKAPTDDDDDDDDDPNRPPQLYLDNLDDVVSKVQSIMKNSNNSKNSNTTTTSTAEDHSEEAAGTPRTHHGHNDDDEEEDHSARHHHHQNPPTPKQTTTTTDEDDIVQQLQGEFHKLDMKFQHEEQIYQNNMIEKYILQEQELGRTRRAKAALLHAQDEQTMACEIADLRVYRRQQAHSTSTNNLHTQIGDAERAYLRRKAIFAKAAQVASSECRLQFSRVQDFFQTIHARRIHEFRLSHIRNIKMKCLTHKLQNTDHRVVKVEMQIANRLYKKKIADLNELHMGQNLEEANYLEHTLQLLNNVQEQKEKCARDVFELQVRQLRETADNDNKRNDELALLVASSKLEFAKLMAEYVNEDMECDEMSLQKQEQVEAMERQKDVDDPRTKLLSISQLYDVVMWSVATNELGLSLTSSSEFASSTCSYEHDSNPADDFATHDDAFDHNNNNHHGNNNDDHHQGKNDEHHHNNNNNSDEDDDDDDMDKMENDLQDGMNYTMRNPGSRMMNPAGHTSSGGSSGAVRGGGGGSSRGGVGGMGGGIGGGMGVAGGGGHSPIGHMRMKQLTRHLRYKEKELVNKHEVERNRERTEHMTALRALRRKQQAIVDNLLEESILERQRLREGIEKRLKDLQDRQDQSSKMLVEEDQRNMQEALQAEDERLAHTEKTSFVKAQTLVSAQVFHEVRNALSSIVAMSEMTTALKKEANVSSNAILSSVECMLDQNKEVVDYALKMLNNVLDISKMQAGSFDVTNQPFDLTDLMARATRMQLPKAGKRVKMSFVPPAMPCVAYGDSNIVVRIIVNMMSNAVKYCPSGAVQPFIWPLEEVFSDDQKSLSDKKGALVEQDGKRMRTVAVGVADTGAGLSERLLQLAETAVLKADRDASRKHGAKSSGFGLHLAHIQSKAIGTKLYLSSLEKCRSLLNSDMIEATDTKVGGTGTVLFITLPVYEGEKEAEKMLEGAAHENSLKVGAGLYRFCPRPAPGCDSFRILIAEDVLMLRKGMVNTISSVFRGCPVSICTAATAEDAVRAVYTNPFDLLIFDNTFDCDESHLKLIPPEEANRPRPRLFVDGEQALPHEIIRDFFDNEQVTIQDGDGLLTGADALSLLVASKKSPFPMPIMMLLSGLKIDLPRSRGIIVAQKPLKRSEFAGLLESHASDLFRFSGCRVMDCSSKGANTGDDEKSGGDDGGGGSGGETGNPHHHTCIVTASGSQIFMSTTDRTFNKE